MTKEQSDFTTIPPEMETAPQKTKKRKARRGSRYDSPDQSLQPFTPVNRTGRSFVLQTPTPTKREATSPSAGGEPHEAQITRQQPPGDTTTFLRQQILGKPTESQQRTRA